MSSLLFTAPSLALLLTLSLLAVIRFVNRRRGDENHTKLPGCALASISFPILTLALFVLLPRAMSSTGVGVSSQTANKGLMTFKLPNAAIDVNFRHAFFSGTIDEADFAITEAEFLKWAAKNDWRPVEFRTDAEGIHWVGESRTGSPIHVSVTPVGRTGDEHVDDLEILNGYYFDDFIGDAGLSVVFDRDGGRAYVFRSTY